MKAINELAIMQMWANGAAGATPRLAKRAWRILEELKHRPPKDLAGTWANASEALRWVKAFHSMGLVGLMDSQRSGRPLVEGETIEQARKAFNALENLPIRSSKVERGKILWDLSRREKESLWRLNRTNGKTLLRNRNGYDLPISTSAGIENLACIFLSKKIKIIGFLEDSNKLRWQHNGIWIGVPKIKNRSLKFKKQPRLLDALSIEISQNNNAENFNLNSQARNTYLISRLLDEITKNSEKYIGKITLWVIADLSAGGELIDLLKKFRARKLWKRNDSSQDGLLKELNIIPAGTLPGTQIQKIIVKNMGNASADELGKLQDLLTTPRANSFCWVRCDDRTEQLQSSNWLAREIPTTEV